MKSFLPIQVGAPGSLEKQSTRFGSEAPPVQHFRPPILHPITRFLIGLSDW